jgi:hypothetical protein
MEQSQDPLLPPQGEEGFVMAKPALRRAHSLPSSALSSSSSSSKYELGSGIQRRRSRASSRDVNTATLVEEMGNASESILSKDVGATTTISDAATVAMKVEYYYVV